MEPLGYTRSVVHVACSSSMFFMSFSVHVAGCKLMLVVHAADIAFGHFQPLGISHPPHHSCHCSNGCPLQDGQGHQAGQAHEDHEAGHEDNEGHEGHQSQKGNEGTQGQAHEGGQAKSASGPTTTSLVDGHPLHGAQVPIMGVGHQTQPACMLQGLCQAMG